MAGLKHKCLAHDCAKRIDARFLMCAPHWSLVPGPIQKRVYAAYRPGQDITTASQAWHDAADEAKQAVRDALAGKVVG